MNYGFMRSLVFFTAALTFLSDRLTKYFVVRSVSDTGPVRIIPGIFHITLVMNNGAAFGMLKDKAALFVFVAMLAISLIIFYALRSGPMKAHVASALGLILGGASGNLVDRLLFGYVIDFLDFRVWPVFNLADSAITIGAAILVLGILSEIRNDDASSSRR